MTPDHVAIRPEWTVAEALSHVRRVGKDSETVNQIYVVDPAGHLVDALSLRRLIVAEPAERVDHLMDYNVASLSAFDDRETAVSKMRRYDVFALPVVDSNGVLLRIVTADDVLDVAIEEATEDFQRVGAVEPLATTYREAGVVSLYRRRIAWLLGLVVVNLASSSVIAAYERTLASVIALAFFIPLLIGSGRNVGSQSATLLVRALATGDVVLSGWLRILGKELAVGVFLGVTMGTAAVLLGLFRAGFPIAIVVGLAMGGIVLLANLIGAMLPFFLLRMKKDPAIASSPLITFFADVAGLAIYFSIATSLLAVF